MTPVEKYIKNELDIVRYRVRMFKSLKNISPAKRRLLERDIEFLEIPFSSIGFKTVKEVSDAIRLYNNSRVNFYKRYDCFDLDNMIFKFNEKLKFLFLRRDEFLSSRVQEVNLIQNSYFYNKLIKYEVENSDFSQEVIVSKFQSQI